MVKRYGLLFLFLNMAMPSVLFAQDIEIFKIDDFDLSGNVKSCSVITDYGKEEYHFDETGRLTKSVTRYNDTDYETTYYRYVAGELTQRRVENYRDNTFDSATSLANFYTIDTTGNKKITEKIITYDKELLEQNVYLYDDEEKLIKIESTDTNGTDEHTFVYDDTENEKNMVENRNGVVAKTTKIQTGISEKDSLQKRVMTQKYLEGQLSSKTVKVIDGRGKLLSRFEALYDSSTEKWIPQEDVVYQYDENGVLAKAQFKRKGFTITKEYIYQFDGTEANNWVKEIITPDNTYTTRRIKYYAPAVADKKYE